MSKTSETSQSYIDTSSIVDAIESSYKDRFSIQKKLKRIGVIDSDTENYLKDTEQEHKKESSVMDDLTSISRGNKNPRGAKLVAKQYRLFNSVASALEDAATEKGVSTSAYLNELLEHILLESTQNQSVQSNTDLSNEFQSVTTTEELGELLTQYRLQAGGTQTSTAEAMGTDHSAVRKIEKGKANPTWNTIQKYVAANGYKVQIKLTPS